MIIILRLVINKMSWRVKKITTYFFIFLPIGKRCRTYIHGRGTPSDEQTSKRTDGRTISTNTQHTAALKHSNNNNDNLLHLTTYNNADISHNIPNIPSFIAFITSKQLNIYYFYHNMSSTTTSAIVTYDDSNEDYHSNHESQNTVIFVKV